MARPIDLALAADNPAVVESRRSRHDRTETPPPVYATRVPSSTELRYALRRGTATGEALVSWRADSTATSRSCMRDAAQRRQPEQYSQGGFDAAGLAPIRLADRRRGWGPARREPARNAARSRFSGRARSSRSFRVRRTA
jgi:hypothetical protein